MFCALPKPVSPSPIIGIDTARQMLRPCSTISPYEIKPVSGMPSRDADTAKPLMKPISKPASSMSRADIAS